MNSVVSVASLASATAVTAPALASDSADAELISVCELAIDLQPRAEEASDLFDMLFVECRQLMPERPEELYWRPGDPIGFYREGGSSRLVCEPSDIKEVRGQKMTDERKQKRLDEIVLAYDKWRAEQKVISSERGLDVAELRANQLDSEMTGYINIIERTQAKTIEGLRAKAKVLACSGGMTEVVADWDCMHVGLARSLIGDLTGLPVEIDDEAAA